MSDIVERLRRYKRDRSGYAEYCHQAADTIEAQAQRIADLEQACRYESDLCQQALESMGVLREALADAIECVQDWGLYASPYFIEKHDLNGDVKRLRAALEASNDPAERRR